MVAPHRQRQGVADLFHPARHALARQPHGVQPRQRCQPQLERGGAQVVAGGTRVLRDQPQALKAHQVAVGLGRAHAGRSRHVFEHERPARAGQPFQQSKPDFHRLDACAFFVHVH